MKRKTTKKRASDEEDLHELAEVSRSDRLDRLLEREDPDQDYLDIA
jgi:hypothetical protein